MARAGPLSSVGRTPPLDSAFNSVVAGVGGSRGATLNQILELARDANTPVVSPSVISADRSVWHEPCALEFYVDFETVNDVNDDFGLLPHRGGQAMIYMVGCGHVEEGEWTFECFVAPGLDLESEAEIIEQWLSHMERVRQRCAPLLSEPLVFHWSPAESS